MTIFDLDDTLIDTSGAVTPWKLREALVAMTGAAAPELLAQLVAINLRSAKTTQAIELFCRQYQISPEKRRAALDSLYLPLPEDFTIPCTPFAKEILAYCRSLGPVALVTGGYPPFQLEKLKKAGIEASLFSNMAVPEDSVKKPFYEAIAREFSVSGAEVWVCGDRVAVDLVPARELGFKTVHMRWGRGRHVPTEPWVDASISELSELRKVIR